MKLVFIEWLDSHSGNGWQRLDDLKGDTRPVVCRSVGWLVSESNGHKTIVPHISGGRDQGITPFGSGDLTIPDKAIRMLRVLRGVPKAARISD